MTPPTVVAHPEVVSEELERPRPAWVERATSGDHKVVGTLYIGAALAFLALAVTELALMRVQLIVPDSTIVRAEIFDRLLSAYGTTAVVLSGIPLGLGLLAYVVPLQIGARRVAFPRLGALSWWLYLLGGVTLYASFLYKPPEAGVIPLPPLSDEVFLPSHGVDAWIAGVGLATLGFVLFAVNLAVTVHRHRAPGMVWRRLPLFAWSGITSAYLLLIVGPVMLAALTMLMIDRHFGGVFFEPGEGGAPVLFQHLSWIYLTGAYLLLLLPAFGAISEILATFARKPPFSHVAIAASFVAIAALGGLAWMQNMLTAPIGIGFAYFAMAIALALVVPFGLVLFNWLATLWGGSIHLRAPMLFALGAVSTTSIGLAGELGQSVVPVSWQLSNTATAWADTHYALIGGAVFGGFAALHYWFGKISGRLIGEGLARISFWTMLVGVHAMLIPMLLAGLEGQPVDVSEYFSGAGVSAYNLISSIGALVLAAGVMLTLANAAYSARNGVRANDDPWGGDTLEWFTASPPPPHNFDLVPDVRSTEPLRDIREAVRRRTEEWTAPEPLPVPEPSEGGGSERPPR